MNYSTILKALITPIVVLAIANSSFSQSLQTEVEIMQEIFGLDKKVAVANAIKLGESADKFWKIYDRYEVERKELGKDRIKVIADYAKSYPNITDEQILVLFNRTKDFKQSFEKLQETYFNRMRKDLGPNIAAQFWQLESYFNVMIQAEIYSKLPFIGENLKRE